MRLAVFFLWLLHWLPLSIQARIGNGLGWVLYRLAKSRRHVARTNLRLCFPEWSEAERERLVLRHIQCFTRAVLEHGMWWWSSPARLRKLIRFEGLAHYHACDGQPVIWLAPHFMGLDAGGMRISMDFEGVSMYAQQKNPVVAEMLMRLRTRFGKTLLFSRQEGIKPVIRAIKQGRRFYYLPDQDFGASDAIFTPFFGVPAATVSGLARMTKVSGAKVVPIVTRQLPGGEGYVVTFYPAWENYPTGDLAADTRRMNAFIEERVREIPEQYFWTHKRFKTRPPGHAGVY